MDKKEIFKVISESKSKLGDLREQYLDLIARDSLEALRELQDLNDDEEFDFTIRDVIDDISYQREKEFDIYQERKKTARIKSYEIERNKLIKSIDRVYWTLLHEIQGHKKTN
jgi:hypothetical protein